MWKQICSQLTLICRVKVSGNLASVNKSNFRLASRPQDVCLGSDEGNVGPVDGHPKKRWVIKSLKQEVIPHFKMNVVFKQIKSLSNANFSGMTFLSFLAFKTLYFHFLFILDPTLCNTWKFIFLGQIFCEKSDSMRWYVIFLIHKSLFPGIEEEFLLIAV